MTGETFRARRNFATNAEYESMTSFGTVQSYYAEERGSRIDNSAKYAARAWYSGDKAHAALLHLWGGLVAYHDPDLRLAAANAGLLVVGLFGGKIVGKVSKAAPSGTTFISGAAQASIFSSLRPAAFLQATTASKAAIMSQEVIVYGNELVLQGVLATHEVEHAVHAIGDEGEDYFDNFSGVVFDSPEFTSQIKNKQYLLRLERQKNEKLRADRPGYSISNVPAITGRVKNESAKENESNNLPKPYFDGAAYRIPNRFTGRRPISYRIEGIAPIHGIISRKPNSRQTHFDGTRFWIPNRRVDQQNSNANSAMNQRRDLIGPSSFRAERSPFLQKYKPIDKSEPYFDGRSFIILNRAQKTSDARRVSGPNSSYTFNISRTRTSSFSGRRYQPAHTGFHLMNKFA